MSPEDLREYAGLTTTVVTCKQRVQMHAAGLDLIRWSMESMFGAVVNMEEDFDDGPDDDNKITPIPEEDEDEDDYDPERGISITPPPPANGDENEKSTGLSGKMFRVMDAVTVRCRRGYVELEWEGNILNDGVADAVLAILLNLESSPAAVKRRFSFVLLPVSIC